MHMHSQAALHLGQLPLPRSTKPATNPFLAPITSRDTQAAQTYLPVTMATLLPKQLMAILSIATKMLVLAHIPARVTIILQQLTVIS